MKIVKKSLPAIATLAAIISTQLMAAPQVINIARPNGSGVSMNNHTSFNVGAEGMVLNNSAGASANTKIAGVVAANRNLRSIPAKVIINQVKSGGSASNLMGVIEVAGKKADVYVANPAGVNCSGCGFINTNRAVLASGTVLNTQWNDIKPGSGTVSFTGAGLSGGDATNVEVYGQKVRIDAPVIAKDFKATISNQKADYYAVDVTALGSVLADSIYLVGNKDGMGVNNLGTLDTTGQIHIVDAGRIVNKGTMVASVLNVSNAQKVFNNGQMQADRSLMVSAGKIENQSNGSMVSDANMILTGREELINKGSIDASAGSASLIGKIDNSGDISVRFLELLPYGRTIKNSGTINATILSGFNFNPRDIDNSGGGTVNADWIQNNNWF